MFWEGEIVARKKARSRKKSSGRKYGKAAVSQSKARFAAKRKVPSVPEKAARRRRKKP